MTNYPSPIAEDIATKLDLTLPEGCDSWGLKSVGPDGRTYGGYQWYTPDPVHVERDSDATNDGPCPRYPGDGLCVARDWLGAQSGGLLQTNNLLVAYHSDDVLGAGAIKLRACRVVVVVDIPLAKLVAIKADLSRADLPGADLPGADLRGANLYGANLDGANLRGANLTEACLTGVNLYKANLYKANLYKANLYGANLRGADLSSADLTDADLLRVDLSLADTTGVIREW